MKSIAAVAINNVIMTNTENALRVFSALASHCNTQPFVCVVRLLSYCGSAVQSCAEFDNIIMPIPSMIETAKNKEMTAVISLLMLNQTC